jgi:hypothetical protein
MQRREGSEKEEQAETKQHSGMPYPLSVEHAKSPSTVPFMVNSSSSEPIQQEQTDRVLCSSHERKAKDLGKGGRKAMKSDCQRWSTGGTSITCETLIPAQAPMRTL